MQRIQFERQLVALLPGLRAFAQGLTGAPATTDDLVQATCERGLRRWRQWSGETKLKSWIYRIAINLWRDELRARKTQNVDPEADPNHMTGENGTRSIVSRVEYKEVRRLVTELPEGQRVALLLVCVEGFSYRETAEILDIPAGTVMSRLSRARAALIDKLGG